VKREIGYFRIEEYKENPVHAICNCYNAGKKIVHLNHAEIKEKQLTLKQNNGRAMLPEEQR
jgi:hypothetical protein